MNIIFKELLKYWLTLYNQEATYPGFKIFFDIFGPKITFN